MTQTIPVYDVDLFSDEVISDPYPHYRALREAGPIVWIPRNDMHVMARFTNIRDSLRNVSVFSSAHGVSANEMANKRMQGNMIASDPPDHTLTRQVVAAPMLPAQLEPLKNRIESIAEETVDRLVKQGRFEVVTELAQVLPLSVVSELVGLPDKGRQQMLEYASAVFDAGGIVNDRTKAAGGVLAKMSNYLFEEATRDAVRPGSWIAKLFEASDKGLIPEARCPVLMRDYVGPSLDTTIAAAGSAVWLFAKHPEQWDIVRSDPSLIPNALNEALRLETPIRGFSRYTTQDCVVDDTALAAGSRVFLMYASGNRDERRWENPDDFDVRRKNPDQLAFGHGVHICAGMHLARLEIHALLNSLVRKVARFEIERDGLLMNNLLRGRSELVVTVH